MTRLIIPDKLIPRLKELQDEHSHLEIYSYLKKINGIQLFTTLGIDLYLTFDGRVLVAKYEEDELEPREAKDFSEVAMAMILGAERRKFPELLSFLPERTENDIDCKTCDNSSGWNDFPGLGKFICQKCGGLGWLKNS